MCRSTHAVMCQYRACTGPVLATNGMFKQRAKNGLPGSMLWWEALTIGRILNLTPEKQFSPTKQQRITVIVA